MESSRRPSLDRSREPGLKKPRIVEEPNRPFSRPVNSGSSRFRASERDRDSDGAGGYVPQPPQQPYQELVNQYKSALSELTFNSKPIITNLTIIAGENLHAAKPIASVVCANILEVPSEQKLPSLYLLDSIVKNIGRDFIKYFAARLPEVFCKAYRHVDPSIHPGMRHLFGTWKGVFPPQPLQIIEKELGFQSAANGSSRSSATRPDSQAQRQPHSIHVNPKYLERQHLQQSSKSKGAASDIGGTVNSTEDVERPERAASFGAQRTGPDAGVKMQRPQRAPLGVSSREKDIGTGYGDYEYGSGLSRPSGSGFGRPSGRMAESKQWLDAGRGNEDPVTSQRNGYDVKHGISNYGVTRTGNGRISALQNVVSKNSGDMSNSWKNSEEEEYTWDELTSKGTDRAALHGSRKDPWTPDGLENLEFEKSETSLDSVSGEQKEQVPFGNRRTSPWQWQEPQSIDGSLVSKTGFHSHTGPSPVGTVSVSGPTGYAGHSVLPRGKHPVNQYTPSPSLSSRDPRLNFVEKEHNQAPPSRNPVPGLSDMGTRNNKFPDSLPSSKQNLQLDSLKEMQPHDLQRFSDLAPSLQSRLRGPLPQQLSTSPLEAEPSDQSQRSPHDLQGFHKTRVTLSSDQLNPLAGDVPVQSKTSSLLAALTKSGVLSKTPDNLSSGNVATAISEPGSRPPAKSVLSDPRHASSGGLHEDSQKLQRPPLPTAVQPLSSSPEGSTSAQTSNAGTTGSIGFTSLLSTLVSKGLISASNSESVAPASAEALKQLQKQSPTAAANAARVNSALVSSNSNTSTDDKRHSAEFADISSETSPQIKKEEIESLIGFEFRPRVLRELHETVIDGLFDSLPHRCSICGLRFKLQERLARHLKWHESKDSESNNSNAASRRWYSNSADWVVGKEELPFGFTAASPSQKREEAVQENAEMVPADEDRCVCFLCGQLFEDFYSLDRDEWMFKGAVFMTVPSEGSEGSSGNCESSVFVHAKCRSDTSAQDLGLVNRVKVEQGT